MVIMNQDGLKISSASRFSTIAASCAVFSGKWMYEVHLSSKGIMQIGWCSNLCQFTLDRGCGKKKIMSYTILCVKKTKKLK